MTNFTLANPSGKGIRGRELRKTAKASADWFVTPPEVTLALLERELFTQSVWECACGDGAMSRMLEARGYDVFSTDLVNRGYGIGSRDFLKEREPWRDSIVTNPPFNAAGAFAQHALALGARKVALLGRLAFLEGEARHEQLFAANPPSRVWVFSKRQTLWAGDLARPDKAGRGAMAYAWFVWERGHRGSQVGFIA